jgi:hypothetical protein
MVVHAHTQVDGSLWWREGDRMTYCISLPGAGFIVFPQGLDTRAGVPRAPRLVPRRLHKRCRRLHEDGTDVMAPIKLLFAVVQIVSKAVLLSSLYRHRWVRSCWHAFQSTNQCLSNTRTFSCSVCVECLGAYGELSTVAVGGVAPNQRCMQHSIGAWITSFVWP